MTAGDLCDDAVGEAGYVVGHYQEIARAAATDLDPVRQYRLDLEAQVLEGGARGGLIGGHLGRDLFKSERAREIEYFGGEAPAESRPAVSRRRDDADFADPPGPSRLIEVDAGVGGEIALDLGEQRDGVSVLDVIDPTLDDGAVGDVGAEKEQVIGGQVAGEIDYAVEVCGFHHADGGAMAVAQLKLHWIRTIGLDLLGH